jgi:hypothetical protein
MYGTGTEDVVSRDEVWRAISAIPADRSYALALALIAGPLLAIAGFITALRGPRHIAVGILGIGAGLASAMSSVIVLKHYALHYAAGVSATLPASLVVFYLLVCHWGSRPRVIAGSVAAVAIAFMAGRTLPPVIGELAGRTMATGQAKADLPDLQAHLAAEKRVVMFVYKAPFAEYGEGFVVNYGSVPRLNEAYLKSRPNVISSAAAGLIDREIGAYVLDKGYFPTAASIKAAPNIALLTSKPVTMADTDKLIELRSVWLLIRK